MIRLLRKHCAAAMNSQKQISAGDGRTVLSDGRALRKQKETIGKDRQENNPNHCGSVIEIIRTFSVGLSARIFPLWAVTMLWAMDIPNP